MSCQSSAAKLECETMKTLKNAGGNKRFSI
jgi:hypothetical protein